MSYVLEKEIIENIIAGTYQGDPFSLFGMHPSQSLETGEKMLFIRTFQPQAACVCVLNKETGENLGQMRRVHPAGLFQMDLIGQTRFFSYELEITLTQNETYRISDPYAFMPVLGELDLYLWGEGTHYEIYKKLGAHPITHQGVKGVSFAVWAPNAKRVSVVGPFNGWDGRRHLMRPRGSSGIWELFVPGMVVWDIYKFELIGPDGRLLPLKTDPFGFAFEMRPKTAALVYDLNDYEWQDADFISRRGTVNALEAPVSIYEMHLGSWRRTDDNKWLTYRELAEILPTYVKELGFTHVEFMPLAEYPFDGSWGYQETGLFAPTSRYGTPSDFKYLVDQLHQKGIGVIMDWVPAHFPKDAFGLANFDGTALYEHADPRRGEHKDWGTKIYNYSRTEVSNFLLSNALFWIQQYHIDALRVDAVASMLYLDYSRKEGEWLPNEYGGRENLEAIAFLRRLNELVFSLGRGATTFAEESTAWPMVSRPTYTGGLGFGYKWNMGWMHDTLGYMSQDSLFKRFHHNELTFSMLYALTENFVLPLSHDEVVHGKGSLLGKMPGDEWQRFANLRSYLTYMFAHPGKKLLFMGSELAPYTEWNFDAALPWHLLAYDFHKGVQALVKDLNTFYRAHPALYTGDFSPDGFEWIDGGDYENSCLTFMRHPLKTGETLVFACNFTPVIRSDYKIGVNEPGLYEEVFNSDRSRYGGSGVMNSEPLRAFEPGWNFKKYALKAVLPPLSVVCFKRMAPSGQEALAEGQNAEK